MKKFLVAAAALSILATAGAANAQPAQRPHDSHQQPSRAHDNDRRDNDHGQQAQGRNDNRYEQRASRRYKAARYQAPRGYQARQWHRGERLPSNYRGRGYVVDYRTYGLGAPPRGYEYVRVGNDAVLTAVATGIIASVVLQLFQ